MKKLKYKSENKVFKIIRIVKNVIFAVILVILVAIIALNIITRISGKTPSILGYSVYRVSSGSMVPTFEVGDIILCRECDPMTLKDGDIITYDGTVGEFAGKSVTHRVIKEPYRENGNYYLVTKGDDNPVEDSPISVSQVTGIFQSKIDLLKFFYDFFITPWGLIAMIFLIILAFFNEIVIFVQAILGTGPDRKKKESVEDIIERIENEKSALAEAENSELIEGLTLADEILEDKKNREGKETQENSAEFADIGSEAEGKLKLKEEEESVNNTEEGHEDSKTKEE